MTVYSMIVHLPSLSYMARVTLSLPGSKEAFTPAGALPT